MGAQGIRPTWPKDQMDLSAWIGQRDDGGGGGGGGGGGIRFRSCIINASGARCSTAEELAALARSRSSAVVTKSCSLEPKEGNAQPRYYHGYVGCVSINSTGLANGGHEYYLEALRGLADGADGADGTDGADGARVPHIVSVACLGLEDTRVVLDEVLRSEAVDAVELNVSCPNVCDSDTIMAYHFLEMDQYLEGLQPHIRDSVKPVGVKLPPYWEKQQFRKAVEVVVRHGFQFVTTINSIPNCLIIDSDTESPVIRPKGGIGGLGGSSLLPVVLSNIHQMRRLLPPAVHVIGCGGIATGKDVFCHLLAGASMVQVGTSLMLEGVGVFERLEAELADVLRAKGYQSVGEAVGGLRAME